MRTLVGSFSRLGGGRILNALLSTVAWQGDEIVLDLVCGDGRVTIAVAKLLRSGYAVGVDDWNRHRWSLRDASNAVNCAQASGLRSRALFQDADARDLPFEDCCFDVVLSMDALGHLSSSADRALALREMVRVTRDEGRCSLFGTRHVSECRTQLEPCGLSSLTVSKPIQRIVMGKVLTGIVPRRITKAPDVLPRMIKQTRPIVSTRATLPPWLGDE